MEMPKTIPDKLWDCDISFTDVKFYHGLLSLMNENNGVTLTNKELTSQFGYNERKIQRILASLKQEGLIEVVIPDHYHRTIYPQYLLTPEEVSDGRL